MRGSIAHLPEPVRRDAETRNPGCAIPGFEVRTRRPGPPGARTRKHETRVEQFQVLKAYNMFPQRLVRKGTMASNADLAQESHDQPAEPSDWQDSYNWFVASRLPDGLSMDVLLSTSRYALNWSRAWTAGVAECFFISSLEAGHQKKKRF